MDRKGALAGGLVDVAGARRAGLPCGRPPAFSCEWCGRSLEPRGIVVNGKVVWAGHEPCGCAGSLAAAAAAEAESAAERERERTERVAAAGVPRRFLDAPIREPACGRYLREFGERPGRGLYIHGGIGAGKTELASALARRFVEAGYRTVLTTTIGMLERIQETYGSEASSAAACRAFGRCDVLLLDDLGKESASSWSVMTMFQVVNMRYESVLPLIVTSQYGPEVLARRLARGGERDTAEAIRSRILGTSDVVWLQGPDRRLERDERHP